jgi:hypothetical protein
MLFERLKQASIAVRMTAFQKYESFINRNFNFIVCRFVFSQ